MSEVTITKTLFGGNFEDMAEYTDTYVEILRDLWESRAESDYPDADITIDIDVQDGVEGPEKEVQVCVDGDEVDNFFFISDEEKAWQKTIDAVNS